MMKFPCLVLDHDDTVVRSEETVNYPYFCEILDRFRPGTKISLSEYTEGCYYQGFARMCKDKYNFTEEEMAEEYRGWKAYIRDHIPAPFHGIKDIILKQKTLGGLVCVVSHSTEEIIKRDYLNHFGLLPDAVFGWDRPEAERKPNAYPLTEIMNRFDLCPTDLLVIDDMKPGWEMASKLQVPIAFAGWGRQLCPEIVREMTGLCDYAFLSIQDFYDFLYKNRQDNA